MTEVIDNIVVNEDKKEVIVENFHNKEVIDRIFVDKLAKKDDPRYIINPKSGRWVLKDGSIGRRVARAMTREELSSHIRMHSVNSALQNRQLLKSDLGDDELREILIKLVDVNLVNAGIPVRSARDKSPPVGLAPPPSRHIISRKVRRRGKKKRHNKFIVHPPVEPAETTDFGTQFEDTDIDETSSSETNVFQRKTTVGEYSE